LQRLAPSQTAKVLYVPHGLPLALFPFRDAELSASRALLSVGRLVEKKGFLVLLQALSILREHEYSIEATIVGEGPQRSILESVIEKLGLRDSVHLCGAQPHEEVLRQMQRCNCFVVPSVVARDGDRDGLPNVLLEAAACGVPIVASDVGGVTDFVDESTGRLAAPGDAPALAALIRQVFEEPHKTRELCRAARQRVEANFDADLNIQALVRAFRSN
jgi:glycosyltransferase involved in cell wall biosynthesis